MQYTIYPESKLQKLYKSIKSKAENVFISSVLMLAKFSKSKHLINWYSNYMDKKINSINHEIIRDKWDSVTLNKALDSIHKQ